MLRFKTQHIVAIVVLLAVAGAGGATYQFYFKKQLDEYSKNEELWKQLKGKHSQLDSLFGKGNKPEEVAQAAAQKVQPWAEAAERRSRFFTLGDFDKVAPIPETGVLPKAEYSARIEQMKNQVLADAYAKGVAIPGVDPYFGQPTPNELAGTSPKIPETMKWLRDAQFGGEVTRLLLDSGALQIDALYIWPPRTENGIFQSYTIGTRMWMRMRELCTFMQDLQYDDQKYFQIHGFRIQNPYLRVQDPPIQVEILFSMASYGIPEEAPPDASGGTGAVAIPAAGELMLNLRGLNRQDDDE
ncbi:MAG: hypothetical protein IT365_06300 [Candidatus Hydrogenedentes bacterium]|nr:hypothetical protein [Candidatus Hydrogenedentota bacterium]